MASRFTSRKSAELIKPGTEGARRPCPGSDESDSRFAPGGGGPVFSVGGGLRATRETSPSLVYGAALLMRLGS